MSIKNGKLIYHLTSLENLDSIISNGLLPRNMLSLNYIGFEDVADPQILAERDIYNLANYVPFHFYAKNPFDYVVQNNNPDTEFVYICLHRDTAECKNFRILPKHPLAAHIPPDLYNYAEGINAIDWDIMEEKDYIDRSSKATCLAEALFPGIVPVSDFQSIVVKSIFTQIEVKKILRNYNVDSVFVDVRPNYFF